MLNVLQPVKDKFKTAMDYHTYSSDDQSQAYNYNVARKISEWSKRLTVQMKSQTFDAVEPITIVSFFNDPKLACDNNGVHEGTSL